MLVKKLICRLSHFLREDMTAWPTSKLQLSFWKCGYSIFKYRAGSPRPYSSEVACRSNARGETSRTISSTSPNWSTPGRQNSICTPVSRTNDACSSRIHNWRLMLRAADSWRPLSQRSRPAFPSNAPPPGPRAARPRSRPCAASRSAAIGGRERWRCRRWDASSATTRPPGGRIPSGTSSPGASRTAAAVPQRRTAGAFMSGSIANGVEDRAWIVRTATALALGECRDPRCWPELAVPPRRPVRPVRLAAAALAACGGSDGAAPPSKAPTTRPSASATPRCRLAGAPLHGAPGAWSGRCAVRGQRLPRPRTTPPRGRATSPARVRGCRCPTPRGRDPPLRPGEGDALQRDEAVHARPPRPERPAPALFLTVAEHLRVPGRPGAGPGRRRGLGQRAAGEVRLPAVTLDIATACCASAATASRARTCRALHRRGHDRAADPGRAFDAVVVIDALHHVPDVPRRLPRSPSRARDGGQFLLAEPGEGHAESEKSRAEMAEHGVCEREIHLLEAVRYGRAAGFDQVRAGPPLRADRLLLPRGPRRGDGDRRPSGGACASNAIIRWPSTSSCCSPSLGHPSSSSRQGRAPARLAHAADSARPPRPAPRARRRSRPRQRASPTKATPCGCAAATRRGGSASASSS